jgi:hypothetical protein
VKNVTNLFIPLTLSEYNQAVARFANRYFLSPGITILLAFSITAGTVYGQEQEGAPAPTIINSDIPEATHTLDELQSLIEQQREQLKQQHDLLTEQDSKIDAQEKQLENQKVQIEEQRKSLESHVSVLNSLQTQLDQLAMSQGELSAASDEDKVLLTRLQTVEDQLAAIPEDPALSRDQEVRPGSIALPGTNASLKIGGYVKMAIIRSFDPLASSDRFIVGSIPVTEDNEFSYDQYQLSSSQSRLNLDLIEKTRLGNLRAFVEGDFAGAADTFRLRHAYGQFRDVLAGKTWSVFYDPIAAPEELDFEGINGQVNVRQSQLRYFPAIGKDWDFSIAIEDPDAQVSAIDFDTGEISDAEGVSRQPDVTFSLRKNFGRLSHIKLAAVLRKVSARSEILDSTEDEYGWGLNLSAVSKLPTLNERDNLKWQLIYGEGIGRYINDLNTLGGMDGVFDTEGKIRTLPVLAGYISYQHWWSESMRSSLLYSTVRIDNYSFQPDDAYYKTQRVSVNFVYSPIPRIDIGSELIWGRRTNKDGLNGKALQAQLSGRVRF